MAAQWDRRPIPPGWRGQLRDGRLVAQNAEAGLGRDTRGDLPSPSGEATEDVTAHAAESETPTCHAVGAEAGPRLLVEGDGLTGTERADDSFGIDD